MSPHMATLPRGPKWSSVDKHCQHPSKQQLSLTALEGSVTPITGPTHPQIPSLAPQTLRQTTAYHPTRTFVASITKPWKADRLSLMVTSGRALACCPLLHLRPWALSLLPSCLYASPPTLCWDSCLPASPSFTILLTMVDVFLSNQLLPKDTLAEYLPRTGPHFILCHS